MPISVPGISLPETPAPAGPGAAWRLVAAHLPAPQMPAAHVRGLARHIVAEPQFRQPAKPWVTSAEEWLARQLSAILNALLSGGRPTALGWVVIAAALGVTALLVTRFARRVRRDPGTAMVGAGPPRRSGAAWAAMAARHAAAGEWRDALRCRYRALVARLAERGVLDEVPGRTTREYNASVARNLPGAGADFAGASELFDAAWYGNRPTGSAEDDQLDDLCHRVLARVSGR